MQKTYKMLVKNKPGCLDRIAGITRRFGWNIVSMVAAETPDTNVTSITIAIECDKFCEWPDKDLEALDFVLSMQVCDDENYTFHEVLVARGQESILGAHLDSAAKVVRNGGECTAWWLGEDAYIFELEKEVSRLPGVKAVRSGPMALPR